MDTDLTLRSSGDDPWTDDCWDDERPFGPNLGLDGVQQRALAAAIDAGLREHGCDNTLRAARRWAGEAGVRRPALRDRLRRGGGYCDCEVVLNVLPEEPEPD
jgi:hypothetical protein